jgi:DNA-binding response OmpR family regulator
VPSEACAVGLELGGPAPSAVLGNWFGRGFETVSEVTCRPAVSIATAAIPATEATAASQTATLARTRAFTLITSRSTLSLGYLGPDRDNQNLTIARTAGTVAHVAVILIIEDDAGIRAALSRALTDRGHAVQWQPGGLPGLQCVIDDRPDVVLLDLGLPDVDGIQVLTMLRAVSEVPVIVVTAREEDTDAVRALDAGADDFVTKPFGADHLDARIRAVLRRGGPQKAEGPLTVGGLALDARTRVATLDGDPLELSRKEFDLLLALAQRAGEVVSKRELLAEVWQQPYGGGDRTIDVHLSWLRRKLGESAAEPRYLHSTRGVGIRLVAPGTD